MSPRTAEHQEDQRPITVTSSSFAGVDGAQGGAAAWSGPPGTERVVETHTAFVFLTAGRAYKVRKPVRFAFVDYTTLSARRRAAEAEVALNTALAPGIYLAVLPLVRRNGALTLGSAGESASAVDHVVVMRRFAEADTLASRLPEGRILPSELGAIGARLAAFHHRCPSVAGGAVSALARVDRGGEELLALGRLRPGGEDVARVINGLQTVVLGRAAEFDARAGAGCWRDGHGDLRAEHVVLERGGLRIVDRLEFDAGLRQDDVAADLAFLLMDLEARGERAAATTILAGYREAGGDPGGDRLLACWGSYRATVAAKVALLRARQGVPAADAVANDRLRLARRLLWRAAGADVIVICGPPASGKSTLAGAVRGASGGVVLSSDRVRKVRLGIAPDQRAGAGAYTGQVTTEVYRDLGRRAADLRRGGELLIVDATMHRAGDRARFLGALGEDAHVRWVLCAAPAAVTRRRAAERERDVTAVSDATPAVAAALTAASQPLDEVAAADVITVRTDGPDGQAVDEVERWVWSWPAET